MDDPKNNNYGLISINIHQFKNDHKIYIKQKFEILYSIRKNFLFISTLFTGRVSILNYFHFFTKHIKMQFYIRD